MAHPALAAEFERVMKGDLPDELAAALPSFPAGTGVETRTASGQALNALAKLVPEIIGGDADLCGSTKTTLKDAGSFDGQSGAGRNIHFGVREHAHGVDRQRHGVPRRRAALHRHLLLLRRLHAPGGAPGGDEPPAGDPRVDARLASAWAKTAPRTSRSSS